MSKLVNELMAFVFWLFLKSNRSDNRRVLASGVEGKERWVAARPWEVRVHAEPNNLKKVHSRQGSKMEIKIPVLSTKPALSNGKVNAKAKKMSSPAVDYQATQDASSTAGSSHLLIQS